MSVDTSIKLEATPRAERGKNAARRLRAQGLVPVTVYGGGQEAAAGTINKREFAALVRAHGRHAIFTLNLDGASSPVKIADLQADPVKGTLVHLDFMRLSMTERSTFEVTIKVVGEPEGVKMGGGILDVVLHAIDIRCLPGDLPAHIEVDVTPLGIGQNVRVGDLKLDADKIEVLTDAEQVIATVVAPRVEEEAAPTEGAAEPEVIKKGKTDEEK
jgi:large subunit ribosomal protein L25